VTARAMVMGVYYDSSEVEMGPRYRIQTKRANEKWIFYNNDYYTDTTRARLSWNRIKSDIIHLEELEQARLVVMRCGVWEKSWQVTDVLAWKNAEESYDRF